MIVRNIVLVSDDARIRGGVEQVAVLTASELATRGFNVYYFAGTGEPDKKLLDSERIHVINMGQTDILHDKNKIHAAISGIYNREAANKLRQLLATLNSSETVVHIHQFTLKLSVSVMKTAVDMGFHVFLTVHNYMLSCPTINFYNYVNRTICELSPMSMKCFLCNCDKRHYYHKIWRFIRQYVQNKVIRNITCNGGKIGYIFISEFSKNQLLRRMPAPKNQFFLHNPIHFHDRFRVKVENNSIFTFIGRIDPEKGIQQFCEAVHKSGVKGVVIGDGALRAELETAYPEITFTGWLDKLQILEWLKKTRCLIFPSVWYEVSPLVPPEVNAYGIPVIASDCNAATDNASFVYHSSEELEDIMRLVNTLDIKALSEEIYNSFDESVTTNYADNLMKIYESPLV